MGCTYLLTLQNFGRKEFAHNKESIGFITES